jgi:hypothetical protein
VQSERREVGLLAAMFNMRTSPATDMWDFTYKSGSRLTVYKSDTGPTVIVKSALNLPSPCCHRQFRATEISAALPPDLRGGPMQDFIRDENIKLYRTALVACSVEDQRRVLLLLLRLLLTEQAERSKETAKIA